jgi:hypothetical protein
MRGQTSRQALVIPRRLRLALGSLPQNGPRSARDSIGPPYHVPSGRLRLHGPG